MIVCFMSQFSHINIAVDTRNNTMYTITQSKKVCIETKKKINARYLLQDFKAFV